MKRHPSLAPLAREHHSALILSQLLKKGAPPYKGMPADVEGKAVYATHFYHTDLVQHFAAEEKVFEKLKGISNSLDALIKEINEEHVLLHRLFQAIPKQVAKEDYLNILGHTLEKHIRKEDRILFPMIEEQAGESMLLSIAELLLH